MRRFSRRTLTDISDVVGISSKTSWWLAVDEEGQIAAFGGGFIDR